MTWKMHVKSLNTLLKVEPQLQTADDRTLTVYLPVRAEGFEASQYDIMLKHLDESHAARLDDDQRAVMRHEMSRLRMHLNLVRPAGCPALVAFANEARGLLRMIRLPESVEPRLEVGEPLLAPIELMLTHRAPALVVVVEKKEARLFASVLGEVIALDHVEGLDVKHIRSGGTSAPSNQRKEMNRTRANIKRVVEILQREMQRGEFSRIFVAGPAEARAEFMRALPKPEANAVAGTLSVTLDNSPGKMLSDIRDQMARAGRVSPAA
jgi:Bacterial archaeo-eukaryotic release factor family 10